MKVGDKVKVKECEYAKGTNRVGADGVIAEPSKVADWRVWFGEGEYDYYSVLWDCFDEHELELVTES